jgi:oligoribonuclease NrnB/cAMP/cGMP phosphodiesterase (DHH superfamily)
MKTLVIYHGDNCSDGFVAAYVAYLALGTDNVEYVAATYGDPIPDVTGKIVFILDFSYSPEVLIEAAKTASQIHLMDHHKSAYENWLKFTGDSVKGKESFNDYSYERLLINFDMTRSGAGMARDHWKDELNKREDVNLVFLNHVVNAVQDRDLWLKKLNNTEAICCGLNLIKRNFECYDNTFKRSVTYGLNLLDLIDRGGIVLKTTTGLCEAIVSRAKPITFDGYEILAVNCNRELRSEVGHILTKDKLFSLTYEINGIEATVSLRSCAEGLDVSMIASMYGGGGHRDASGFKMSLAEFFPKLKPIA